jgi:hypothetical protein
MKNIQFKEVLRSNDKDWKTEADELAAKGIPFVLVGFSYPHHVNFYNELSLRYGLECHFEPDKKRAFFWKK